MNTFIDPRSNPDPTAVSPQPRTTADLESLKELHRLCREGRLYEVERWIGAGRPLQLDKQTPASRRRVASALEIALDWENHALVLLLLCNGYDPDLERRCPLDLALRARRWDLVDLLLEWGADPRRVDLDDLFGTYNSELFERFRALAVDLTEDHQLAEALAYHTSNKPLFGFAKRHRTDDPAIQTELDIALAYHAGEGNEKGVSLCLWAGADPHVPVPDLRYPDLSDDADEEADEEEPFHGYSAMEEACRNGSARILKQLGPDPSRDDFDELYRAARNRAVVESLARVALPSDADAVIQSHLWWATFEFLHGSWWSLDTRSLDTLRCLFELGLRWEACSNEELAGMRRSLLGASDEKLVELMKLLATKDYCAPAILHQLARTPAMRRRMKEVGFIPSDEPRKFGRPPQPRPTRSREVLSKFGVELKKPKGPQARSDSGPTAAGSLQALPRTVRIGREGGGGMGSLGARSGEGVPPPQGTGAPAWILGYGQGGSAGAPTATAKARAGRSRRNRHLGAGVGPEAPSLDRLTGNKGLSKMTSHLVCGIDTGTFATPSYVAWLRDDVFVLDLYQASPEVPLPPTPDGMGQIAAIALDVPQGLPAPGRKRRKADELANTPTRVLPTDRKELAAWKLYKGLIETGIEIFWSVHERGVGRIPGLEDEAAVGPVVLETYPRYVITRLWPDLRIPSKRKAAVEYAWALWSRLKERGYRCESVLTPTVDQVDAMLCAVAAEAYAEARGLPNGSVGEAPRADHGARVTREGYIVAP